jgi:hypothetical protein
LVFLYSILTYCLQALKLQGVDHYPLFQYFSVRKRDKGILNPFQPLTVILLHRLAVLQVYQITALCFRHNCDTMKVKCASMSDVAVSETFNVLRNDIFAFMFCQEESESTLLSMLQERIGYLVHCKLLLYNMKPVAQVQSDKISEVEVVSPPDSSETVTGLLIATVAERAMLSRVVPRLKEVIYVLQQQSSILHEIVDNLFDVSVKHLTTGNTRLYLDSDHLAISVTTFEFDKSSVLDSKPAAVDRPLFTSLSGDTVTELDSGAVASPFNEPDSDSKPAAVDRNVAYNREEHMRQQLAEDEPDSDSEPAAVDRNVAYNREEHMRQQLAEDDAVWNLSFLKRKQQALYNMFPKSPPKSFTSLSGDTVTESDSGAVASPFNEPDSDSKPAAVNRPLFTSLSGDTVTESDSGAVASPFNEPDSDSKPAAVNRPLFTSLSGDTVTESDSGAVASPFNEPDSVVAMARPMSSPLVKQRVTMQASAVSVCCPFGF